MNVSWLFDTPYGLLWLVAPLGLLLFSAWHFWARTVPEATPSDGSQPELQTLVLDRAALQGGLHAATSSATPHPHEDALTKIGRYRIEHVIGRGAMGVVYQGREIPGERRVAIKTLALSQEFDADELTEVKERFFREAETAGRLRHANIVTMLDAGEEGELAYLAMEFLEGGDLVAFTKPGALLPLATTLSIVMRVADALGYAHENNVVHRDVKPANVMYDPASDQVKVTDFGIARLTDSCRTKTGMVLGTPSFMSPEQLIGQKIDGRSDLFSLGVMLYQLACGRLPFIGQSMAQLMYKIANEPHQDIRSIDPQLPAGLAFVLDKALKKNAAERFQTGADMAKAIRACLMVMEKSSKAQTGEFA